jgi:predicted DNA-binding transcriptional regulator AlpA
MASNSTDEWLTVAEVVAMLKVSRRTFYRWRELMIGPESIKLPNGEIRIRQSVLNSWLAQLQDYTR